MNNEVEAVEDDERGRRGGWEDDEMKICCSTRQASPANGK